MHGILKSLHICCLNLWVVNGGSESDCGMRVTECCWSQYNVRRGLN